MLKECFDSKFTLQYENIKDELMDQCKGKKRKGNTHNLVQKYNRQLWIGEQN